MELPSLVLFSVLCLSGNIPIYDIRWVFFGLWVIHYLNRVFVFPLRTRTKGKKMPALIMLLAMVFKLVNAFINGYWLGYTDRLQQSFGGQALDKVQGAGIIGPVAYDAHWISDPRFIIGVSLFITGVYYKSGGRQSSYKTKRKKR